MIGVNAMSLISPMREDFSSVIRRLAEGGCDRLELMSDWGARPETIEFYSKMTGGPSGWDPENTIARLREMRAAGIGAEGMFVFDDCLLEQAEEMGAYCRDNGLNYVVLSYLDYGNIDEIYAKIEKVRKVAAILKPYGVQVIQHNHEHDLVQVEDRDGQKKAIIDIFLEQTTPEELMLEIDTGWVLYAGADPAEYIRERLDRIQILHLKDISKDYKTLKREEIFVPCGAGAVDFPGILAAIPEEKRSALKYVIDQDDSAGDIVEDQVTSIRYLRTLGL